MLDLPFGLALDVLRGRSGREPRISVPFRHHFRSSRCLACSSSPAAERFYWFGFFSIQSCKAAFCIAVHTEQFVELRVYGLSVAMVRSLNEQRHEKCRDADYRMPAQSVCRKCEDRGKDGARPRSGARYAALVAMVLLAKRKQTAWSNVPPYLEISEPRAQMVIGSRRIGALKASSSMIATRGLSPNVTSPSARKPGNAMVGTRHP